MKIKKLAQWYGSDIMANAEIVKQLGKLKWCGVPFCGGCSILPLIDTRAGVAGDLHCHVINLAKVVSDELLFETMKSVLDRALFHPIELSTAQMKCKIQSVVWDGVPTGASPSVAAAYLISTWMGRGGNSGIKGELDQSLSVRWGATGGDSAVRFWSMVNSLPQWHKAFRERWSFQCIDAFVFLEKVKFINGHGLYIDAPWVVEGENYLYPFTETQHMRLATKLCDNSLSGARIVVRYGDCPLIRKLYPEPLWTWIKNPSRTQANALCDEVLLVNGSISP